MRVVRLAVGPETVGRALAAARGFADACSLEAAAADQLAVVVEEWVANILEHGRPSTASLVVMRLSLVDEGGVRLAFSDAGVAFDMRLAAPAEGPNLERGGGAGLALIRAWCEVEAYRRRGGRNRLVLRSKS
ncbi:MAG: ATP-binding protein [Proteobacteria bacterium]|nr:ATP-binding protein [Pseudomonadota bacterium]